MIEPFELVHGSDNVFRDLGYPDADLRHAKCLMAAEIIKTLDEREWTTRKAQEATGVSHAEFSRIRKVNLGRFTLDRLLKILALLGQDVTVSVEVKSRGLSAEPVTAIHRAA